MRGRQSRRHTLASTAKSSPQPWAREAGCGRWTSQCHAGTDKRAGARTASPALALASGKADTRPRSDLALTADCARTTHARGRRTGRRKVTQGGVGEGRAGGGLATSKWAETGCDDNIKSPIGREVQQALLRPGPPRWTPCRRRPHVFPAGGAAPGLASPRVLHPLVPRLVVAFSFCPVCFAEG